MTSPRFDANPTTNSTGERPSFVTHPACGYTGERYDLGGVRTGLKYPLPPAHRTLDRNQPIDWSALQ